jgi:ribosomal protein S18 acetylase RimI-like enzyme
LFEASHAAAARRPVVVRPLAPRDVPRVEELIRGIDNFNEDEVACAIELVGLAAGPPPGADDYRVLVASAEPDGAPLGYACFGPTPMTRQTFDLYWIAATAEARGRGVGRALHDEVVRAVRAAGGRRIRVETSSLETYGATQRFYDATGYRTVGRVDNFYKDGDHLLILLYELGG